MFRKLHQQANKRLDYDLYDPMALKNSKPPRTIDGDDQVGPSCLQKFEGEDDSSSGRLKRQQEQMRVWTQVHLYEKEALRLEQVAETRYSS